jgi:hypothetical protein
MPSPFPGMDPYPEGTLWMSVHTSLAVEIVRQLTPKLRPRYMALTTRRYVVDVAGDVDVTIEGNYPDVSVVRSESDELGTLATGVLPSVSRLTTLIPESIPQISVEIHEAKNRRLVTVIEVLSPTNKRGDGRDEYLAKRNKILLSKTHLIEIDLLRRGRRVPMKDMLPPAPYFVFVSRSTLRPLTDVWPILLNQTLPTVAVPLLNGDADATLDLQEALTSVYDSCGLDLAIDYTNSCEVPLPPKAAAWADERLRAAGLRT